MSRASATVFASLLRGLRVQIQAPMFRGSKWYSGDRSCIRKDIVGQNRSFWTESVFDTNMRVWAKRNFEAEIVSDRLRHMKYCRSGRQNQWKKLWSEKTWALSPLSPGPSNIWWSRSALIFEGRRSDQPGWEVFEITCSDQAFFWNRRWARQRKPARAPFWGW